MFRRPRELDLRPSEGSRGRACGRRGCCDEAEGARRCFRRPRPAQQPCWACCAPSRALNDLVRLLSARSLVCSPVAAALPQRSTLHRVIGVAGGSRRCCLISSSNENYQRSSAPQAAAHCSACRGTPIKEGRMRKGLWHRHLLLRGVGQCSGPKLYHPSTSGRPPRATSGCSQLYMCSS